MNIFTTRQKEVLAVIPNVILTAVPALLVRTMEEAVFVLSNSPGERSHFARGKEEKRGGRDVS